MKKYFLIITTVCGALTIVVTSCKKDNASPNKTELITSKNWMETKTELTYSGVTTDVSDVFLRPCEKDNVITFSKDGSYTFKTGADDCGGDEPDEKGSWAFKNSETMLHIAAPGDTIDVTIVTISSTTLKFSTKPTGFDINGDGKDDDVTEAITLTAK